MAFYIKQNDTSPSLRAILRDGDGIAINLTDSTVRFHMKPVGTNSVSVDESATVINPTSSGIVQYNWSAADTATVGSYKAEFEVTFYDGTVETFPNNDYIPVIVKAEIT